MSQQVRQPARVVRIGFVSVTALTYCGFANTIAQWIFRIVFQNIQAFTFSYLNSNGALVDGSSNPAPSSADIREVSVKITVRAAYPDPTYPENNGYRTLTLQSRVTPRDLGL